MAESFTGIKSLSFPRLGCNKRKRTRAVSRKLLVQCTVEATAATGNVMEHIS